MSLSWPEPAWCTSLRAAAPELAAGIIGWVGAHRIGDVTLDPSPSELVVRASCRDGRRVDAAHGISTAVAHLWTADLVDRNVTLRVVVDQLEATLPPGWMLGPWHTLEGWRTRAEMRFTGDAQPPPLPG